MARPTPEQIIEFINSDIEAPKPPSPYDIALTMGAALLSSGRFEDVGAAMANGWTCVIPFYQGQATYLAQGTMLGTMAGHARKLAAMAGAPEGSAGVPGETDAMSGAEARAYVSGGDTGETGDLGEAGQGAPFVVGTFPEASGTFPETSTFDKAMAARQAEISRCDQLVKDAAAQVSAAREEFHAGEERPHGAAAKRLKAAEAALTEAQAAQSAAHTILPTP